MYPGRLGLQFLRVVAVIGFVLSLAGLGLSLWNTIQMLVMPPANNGLNMAPRFVILYILYAFREPGLPLLLSGILFVLCEIGLASTHRPLKPERESSP